MNIHRTSQVMDLGLRHPEDDPAKVAVVHGTHVVLLDGKGNALAKDAQPVFLTVEEATFRAKQVKNSRGELYDPQPDFPLPPLPGT